MRSLVFKSNIWYIVGDYGSRGMSWAIYPSAIVYIRPPREKKGGGAKEKIIITETRA